MQAGENGNHVKCLSPLTMTAMTKIYTFQFIINVLKHLRRQQILFGRAPSTLSVINVLFHENDPSCKILLYH